MALKPLYEDSDIIVVHKRPGVLTQAARADLSRAVSSYLKDSPAYPCHRLDKETSGPVIFAKSKSARDLIMGQFRDKKVEKVYIALVKGSPAKDESTINDRLPERTTKGIRYIEASTSYKVISRNKGYSVLEVRPLTGRKNQIRLHLKKIGYPVIGDRKFFSPSLPKFNIKRAALHAVQITFFQPYSSKKISIRDKLPKDILNFMRENP